MLPGITPSLSGLSLTGFLDPASLSRSGTSVPITTLDMSVVMTSGSGSYAYLWIVVNSGIGTIVANSPTSANTTFSSSPPPEEASTAVVRCQVTDLISGAQELIGDGLVEIFRL